MFHGFVLDQQSCRISCKSNFQRIGTQQKEFVVPLLHDLGSAGIETDRQTINARPEVWAISLIQQAVAELSLWLNILRCLAASGT